MQYNKEISKKRDLKVKPVNEKRKEKRKGKKRREDKGWRGDNVYEDYKINIF